ncbi:MAG: DUF4118 domain-containing protein [Bacilli bacterium]
MRITRLWLPYLATTLAIGLLTILLLRVGPSFQLVNIALLFLLPVLFSAARWGFGPSIYAAALSVAAFDYFFVPPFFSFSVSDLRYLISFAVFLSVAILTATLALRLRMQVDQSRQREADTAALYDLGRQMTARGHLPGILEAIVTHVYGTLQFPVWIVLPADGDRMTVSARAGQHPQDDGVDEAVCRWVYLHGDMAGNGTGQFAQTNQIYVPLKTEDVVRGVLVLGMRDHANVRFMERLRLIEAIAGLSAVSIARIQLEKQAQLARLSAESELLRNALLDSISHELRTPLAGIIGSVTGMIENAVALTEADRNDLLFTIHDSAMRMNRLVTNLLGMVRLESGMLSVHRRVCDVSDMLGVAFRQLQDTLQHRVVEVSLQKDLPPLQVDDVLIEQVLVNVLSNAVKYSSAGGRIEIRAEERDGVAVLTVADEGIGLLEGDEEKIFDKFYRAEAAQKIPGTGLGLAICRGIVEAHGGVITAQRRSSRGVRIVIRMPIDGGEASNGGQDSGCRR